MCCRNSSAAWLEWDIKSSSSILTHGASGARSPAAEYLFLSLLLDLSCPHIRGFRIRTLKGRRTEAWERWRTTKILASVDSGPRRFNSLPPVKQQRTYLI